MRINTPRATTTGDGTIRLRWSNNFQSNWQDAFTDTQKFIDSEVLRLSNPYMPMQSGLLQRMGVLGTQLGSGEVVYNSPKARYLFYGKVMVGRAPKTVTSTDLTFHGGNGSPPRGAFWFERMKADKKGQILRGAARILQRG